MPGCTRANWCLSSPHVCRSVAGTREVAGLSHRAYRVPYSVMAALGRAGDFVGRYREPIADSRSVAYTSRYLFYDPSRACEQLGYTISQVEDTLRRSIRWFAENGHIRKQLSIR